MSKLKYPLVLKCLVILFATSILLISCYKRPEPNWSGPYSEAVKTPIKFKNGLPVPSAAASGDIILVKMLGLDSLAKLDRSTLNFYINGVLASIDSISVKDSAITILIPQNASSGSVTLKIGDKEFFGPIIKIKGNLWIDSTYAVMKDLDINGNKVLGGANGNVNDLFYDPVFRRMFVSGSFTQWNDSSEYSSVGNIQSKTSYLVVIDPLSGTIKPDFEKGQGPNGETNGIVQLPTGIHFLPYGYISRWDGWDGPNNMTRIFSNGNLDFESRVVANDDPSSTRNIDTIPRFLGGTESGRPPIKVFVDSRNRLISIGNFTSHRFNLVDYATFSSIPARLSTAPQIMAQSLLGVVDSSYGYISSATNNYPANFKPFNGTIYDAIQLSVPTTYGKIIIAGSFPKGVVMLDDNGKPDPAFTADVNGTVTKITYNAANRKILISGTFNTVNGVSTPAGVAMLTETGALDPTFVFGQLEQSPTSLGQMVTYAGQLNNGNVIVAGNFARYTPIGSLPITRLGFMILSPNGTLVSGLNNTGAFQGNINDIQEYSLGTGKPTVIIAGAISVFDNAPVKNIVRLGMYAK